MIDISTNGDTRHDSDTTSLSFNPDNLRRGLSTDGTDGSIGLMTYDEAIARLEALGSPGTNWGTWQCPAHEDDNPSLSVTEEDGELLLCCHAGCEFEDVIEALREVDLDADYVPRPRAHKPKRRTNAPAPQELYQRRKALEEGTFGWPDAVRNAQEFRGIEPEWLESVKQRFRIGVHERDGLSCLSCEVHVPDGLEAVGAVSIDPRPSHMVEEGKVPKKACGERGLFPSPECFEGDDVIIVEGEIDALALCSFGFQAIGVPGAKNWREEWAPRFKRFTRATVVSDCDAQGRALAQEVARSLTPYAKVYTLDLDPEADDHFDIGDLVMLELGRENRNEVALDLELIFLGADPFEANPSNPSQESEGEQTDQTQETADDTAVEREVKKLRIRDTALKVREREREEELLAQAGDPLITLDRNEREEQRFLFDPYVRYGTLTCIMAASNVGKSTLAGWIAAQHINGVWGDPGYVIHIGTEDNKDRVAERLVWFGADETHCKYWDLQRVKLTFPTGVRLLERRIKQLYDDVGELPLMVVIDTATEYLDPGLEINSHQDVTRATSPLRDLADKLGIALIGIVHLNRQKSDDPQQLTGSSKAWYDRAKSVNFAGRDPDNKETSLHVFHVKNSYSTSGCGPALEYNILRQEKLFKLELLGESDREFREVFDTTVEPKPTKTAQTDEFLRTYNGKLPVALDELETEFLAQYGEDAVTEPISLITLGKRRKEAGLISKKVDGVQYVGRPLDFKHLKRA